MSEDFYAALMMRRTLPPTTNIKTITEPGIYPVDSGNTNAPVSTAGVLVVLPPTTRPKLKFIAADWNVYTLVGESWQGLGTSAIKDVVTSPTDTTAGRVMTVGYGGVGGYGTTILLSAADAKKPQPNGFYGVNSDPTYGNSALISFGYDSGSQVHIIAMMGGQAPIIGLCGSTPQGVFGKWGKIYTEFQKPTAADTGALPSSPNSLTVDLNTLGAMTSEGVYYQTNNTGATVANHYPVQAAGTLFVTRSAYGCQQMYITYSNRIFVRALTGNWTGSGPWSSWVEMYGPSNNPAPDDVNCIQRDGCHIGGFASGDAARPYMRHTASNVVVELAKKGDSYTKAESDNGYAAKTSVYSKGESDARYAMSPNQAGFGGVGTYAFLSCNAAVSNGASVAGASLFSSGVAAQKSGVGYGDKSMVIQGSAMAGTWKCLGNQPAPSGSDVGATLYYRIA